MRVGFIVNEFFKYGSYGGYGFATRAIARGLLRKGAETFLLINISRFKNMPHPTEVDEGVGIIGYKASPINLIRPIKEFKMVDADIYQTCNISLDTNYCMLAEKNKKHVINFQDPRSEEDWKEIYTHPTALIEEGSTKSSLLYDIRVKIAYSLYKKAIARSNGLTIQAKYLAKKVNDIFGINQKYKFLPNPVEVPKRKLKKSSKPTVVFLGRLDLIKRPEIYFELAKRFPKVDFLVVGTVVAGTKKREKILKEKYGKLKNLKFLGLILDEKIKSEILEKSWILINTSLHECLPVSFLEAWAHQCTVLSCQNPDNLTREYGYYTGKILGTGLREEDINKFVNGLKWLLENERWKKLGKKGYNYVKSTHETNKAINTYFKYFKYILNKNG